MQSPMSYRIHQGTNVTQFHGHQLRQETNPLENAGKVADHYLALDRNTPELFNLLVPGVCGLSGLTETDYPISGSCLNAVSIPQVLAEKNVPLPADLVEQFRHMHCNCLMGLLPEIGRAWLTIDSNLFIWSYFDGGDLYYYDNLGETILSIGLIKPKPNIFQSHIKFLLCIATPLEIAIHGMAFANCETGNYAEADLTLLPSPLFKVSSDNCPIQTISGMDNGRIFLGGKDGCLYEILYQAEFSWFRSRCRKVDHSSSSLSYFVPSFFNLGFSDSDNLQQICVDNSRNILYARTAKNSIQVYDLGADGQGLKYVNSTGEGVIAQFAMKLAQNMDRTLFQPFVHMEVISERESKNLHLVVITRKGVRLFFSTVNVFAPSVMSPRPAGLQLVHMRLPPGYTGQSSLPNPGGVHMALYARGVTVMMSANNDDNDVLWLLNKDMFEQSKQLVEGQYFCTSDKLPFSGHAWAIAEIPQVNYVATFGEPFIPPAIVHQHMVSSRKYVILSSSGTYVFTLLKPMEQLEQILQESRGNTDFELLRNYFKVYSHYNACASCILLSMSPSPQSSQVVEWATQVFLKYGSISGEKFPAHLTTAQPISPIHSPHHVPHGQSILKDSIGFNPTQMSTPFSSPVPGQQSFATMDHLSGKSFQQAQTPFAGQSIAGFNELPFSVKHHAIYFVFCRIVRPIWEARLAQGTTQVSQSGLTHILQPTLSMSDLVFLIGKLGALDDYLDRMPALITESAGSRLNRNMTSVRDSFSSGVDMQRQERHSLVCLKALITRTKETLSFWKVLCEHQLHRITHNMSPEAKNQLLTTTFRELIIRGQDIARGLIDTLINLFLVDNAPTEAISHELRRACPAIYRNEDALYSKAMELIVSAKAEFDRTQKVIKLKEAVECCKHITPELNLQPVCQNLCAAGYYEGIVELCLEKALQGDSQEKALRWYQEGEANNDQDGYSAYSTRQCCYKFILNTLGQLLNASMNAVPIIPRTPGVQPYVDQFDEDPGEIRHTCERFFQLCMMSKDELFHISLYRWLGEQNFVDKILEVKTPFVESYLRRTAAKESADNDISVLNLLAKYYVKNGKQSDAARIYATLSQKQSDKIDLSARIEYLTRAKVCVKSYDQHNLVEASEYLDDLDAKLEVAAIQKQVLSAMRALPNHSKREECLHRLNYNLLDNTTMYNDFAVPYNLWECQLAIFYSADFKDKDMISQTWAKLIEREIELVDKLDNNVAFHALKSTLKPLVEKYGNTPDFFPLVDIIRDMELWANHVQLNNANWLYSALIGYGLYLPNVFRSYCKVVELKDPTVTVLKPHLLVVIRNMIKHFMDTPHSVQPAERRLFKVVCQDAISGFLIDLNTPNMMIDQNVNTALMNDFRALQAALDTTITS